MRNGQYVLFSDGGHTYKGRILKIDNEYCLCQDRYSWKYVDHPGFGHSSIIRLGDGTAFYCNIQSYRITKVTKKKWLEYKDPITYICGWSFNKIGKGVKDPHYSFGCGEVKLALSEITDFTEQGEQFIELITEIRRIKKELSRKERELYDVNSSSPRAGKIISIILERDIDPSSINIKRIKSIFGIK